MRSLVRDPRFNTFVEEYKMEKKVPVPKMAVVPNTDSKKNGQYILQYN